jgi:hypothetical protein
MERLLDEYTQDVSPLIGRTSLNTDMNTGCPEKKPTDTPVDADSNML